MSDSINDNDVAQFCALTNCDPSEAEHFLQAANFDLNTAVSLYLEGGTPTVNNPPTLQESSRARHTSTTSPIPFAAGPSRYDYSDGVRAPIQPVRETLMEYGTSPFESNPEMRNLTTEAFRDFEEENEENNFIVEGTAVRTRTSNGGLSAIFRPPFRIMYTGSFENARMKAKEEKRYLIVNVQDIAQFACQAINRDLWSDEILQDFIKESFIFYQINSESSEGKRYINYYPVTSFPHISIIDPRTGERVKSLNAKLEATEFLGELYDFLERYPMAPQEAASSTGKGIDTVDLTQDEQLELAIAMSNEENYNVPESYKLIQSIEPLNVPEPNAGPDVTRLQLRFPDGSKIVRRFSKKDTVKTIFAVVKYLNEEAKAHPFEQLASFYHFISSSVAIVAVENSINTSYLTWDYYDIQELVGEGSFGKVFKGMNKATGEIVAIKEIDLELSEDDIEEIRREITMLHELSSPFIPKYFGSYAVGSMVYIVMEYLDSGSCLDLLELGPMTEESISLIIRDTLKALDLMHDQNKIHRDIKAGNILLSKEGDVKLADFGVAAQLSSGQTKRNTFVGSPYWMAPEVITESGYSTKADIWSLGILCIELATTEPPYSNLHPMKALVLIPKNEPPTLPSNCQASKLFKEFISQCLVKNQNERPTAKDLLKHRFVKTNKRNGILAELAEKYKAYKLKKAEKESRAKQADYASNQVQEEEEQAPSNEDSWDFTIKRPKSQGEPLGTIKRNSSRQSTDAASSGYSIPANAADTVKPVRNNLAPTDGTVKKGPVSPTTAPQGTVVGGRPMSAAGQQGTVQGGRPTSSAGSQGTVQGGRPPTQGTVIGGRPTSAAGQQGTIQGGRPMPSGTVVGGRPPSSSDPQQGENSPSKSMSNGINENPSTPQSPRQSANVGDMDGTGTVKPQKSMQKASAPATPNVNQNSLNILEKVIIPSINAENIDADYKQGFVNYWTAIEKHFPGFTESILTNTIDKLQIE